MIHEPTEFPIVILVYIHIEILFRNVYLPTLLYKQDMT